jgi:hypothetical protein
LTAAKESSLIGQDAMSAVVRAASRHAYLTRRGIVLKEGVMGFSRKLVVHSVQKRALWLMLAAVVVNPSLMRAQSGQTVTVDQATMQALLTRIDRLEARVQQLEAAQHPAALESAKVEARQQLPGETPAHGPSPQAAQEHEPEQTEHAETERMDVSKTLLRIRGFGDVNFHGDNYHPPNGPGDKTAFTLGQLNLFVTSDISDKFKFLGEIVFEAGPDNIYGVTRGTENSFGVDVERYLLTYSQNEYFNLSAGRYHTAIGYYNTAFHHSTWLQTTTGRPLLFEFEDRGGILPIHNVGLEAYGIIPSGSLGLHYVAEVGNGRESRSPLIEEPVQNIVDDSNSKAVNFELFARPIKIPGLQVGFSAYRDNLVPNTTPVAVGETILAAHAVYSTSNFEWLNEALVVRHTPEGGHTYQTPGWYSQISRRWGQYRPYFRYQYINASPNEPIFPDIALRAGPSAGIRYDASESVALKLQYDYTSLRNQPAVQGLQAQIGFTF